MCPVADTQAASGASAETDFDALAAEIKTWGAALGFQEVAITDVDLSAYEGHLEEWIARNFHGEMGYMANNHELRVHPELLHPGTIRVICVRMDYAKQVDNSLAPLDDSDTAYIARYARGRDYHKVLRKRLQKLADQIQAKAGPIGYRAFVDSAPVLERALSEKSGLGWIGKNTMLVNKNAGSWFFLGELFTDLPFPSTHLTIPTAALVTPASTCARLTHSSGLINSTRANASRISLSSCVPLYPKNLGRRWAIGYLAAMTASWCVRGISSPRCRPSKTSRRATDSTPNRL